jgi:hypothetical protein
VHRSRRPDKLERARFSSHLTRLVCCPPPVLTFRRFEGYPGTLSDAHLIGIVLVHDSLNCHPQVPSDVTLFAHDRHFVDERDGVEEVAQVDEPATHHPEPGETVVEGVAPGQRLHIVIGRRGRHLGLVVVHLAHQFESLSAISTAGW